MTLGETTSQPLLCESCCGLWKWGAEEIDRSAGLCDACTRAGWCIRCSAYGVAYRRVSGPRTQGKKHRECGAAGTCPDHLRQAGGEPEVAGARFYERLFATNPSFRPLFKKDIRIQVGRLMTMLATVVYNLHQPG